MREMPAKMRGTIGEPGPLWTAGGSQEAVAELREAIDRADAVLVGAGAGLSTAAGYTYGGERFRRLFPDFIAAYGLTDMYTAGFHPFPSPEVQWAYWSRHIMCNRYDHPFSQVYDDLRRLIADKEHFVLTTNVDHLFQDCGFDRARLFYTQGDYGLWQCGVPCHARTYDNEEMVRRMVAEQHDMAVPSELVPHCPVCGRPMSMNLRADGTFVEDEGWHAAARRYHGFLDAHAAGCVLYLELGVGANTPGIIKYPFWRRVADNPEATYACVNLGEVYAPQEIRERSLLVDGDVAAVLRELREPDGVGVAAG